MTDQPTDDQQPAEPEARQRLLARLAKVERLSRLSPVQGERTSAERQLQAAMQRHGVSEGELGLAIRQSLEEPQPRPTRPPASRQPGVVIIVGMGWGWAGGGGSATTTTGWV